MAKKPEPEAQPASPVPDLPPPAEGGSYVVENGVRRRLEDATKNHPEGNTNRSFEGKSVAADGRPANPIAGDGRVGVAADGAGDTKVKE